MVLQIFFVDVMGKMRMRTQYYKLKKHGMTNYHIGSHWTTSGHIGPHRTTSD